MKSKEIHNLFGEVLSDEIERNVKKNKTLSFKKKSKATQDYHYIPIKNIKHRKETKQFLKAASEFAYSFCCRQLLQCRQ